MLSTYIEAEERLFTTQHNDDKNIALRPGLPSTPIFPEPQHSRSEQHRPACASGRATKQEAPTPDQERTSFRNHERINLHCPGHSVSNNFAVDSFPELINCAFWLHLIIPEGLTPSALHHQLVVMEMS
ncbi:hypothetical protein CEP52_000603 [Fusarium oligoseptatum]|uniref:Uncharacterized protein n=1 Tax=Fusarium oligoseptatum TaxID=2604345 RepID=A0A428UMU2_9HYPO|nr:hypothetical protein CEP52_000603 [Fusarium oligoseptatum]